jgi:hypothetical protein
MIYCLPLISEHPSPSHFQDSLCRWLLIVMRATVVITQSTLCHSSPSCRSLLLQLAKLVYFKYQIEYYLPSAFLSVSPWESHLLNSHSTLFVPNRSMLTISNIYFDKREPEIQRACDWSRVTKLAQGTAQN